MKSNQFIGTIRKGDNTGTIEVTIPQEFRRKNGVTIGEQFLFTVNRIKGEEL